MAPRIENKDPATLKGKANPKAYIPLLQLTNGQPPPVAANEGLSYACP